MDDNFTVWNRKKNLSLLPHFLCFIGGTDAFWLATCSSFGLIWCSREMGPISPRSTSCIPWECSATLPAAPSLCVLSCCWQMLDCSSVGAPGLRGSQAGREHRQAKCRQEAKWPCGVTGAARVCPARSEWQQCLWFAYRDKGSASPVLCQQPSVSASRRGGGKQFYFTLVYIRLEFFST